MAWWSRLILVLLFSCVPLAAMAQTPRPATAPAEALLKTEELDQLVAPIALYPDTLLSQVLIAATYPLEVVQADRWATQNKNLKGDQLKAEVEKQSWDQSVKSLVATPSVLTMMGQQLDWTQKLGDSVLAQQPDVMDAIQRLRSRAQANKKLPSTKEQKVTVRQEQDKQVIVIEPTDPETVHVPYYDPAVVYGEWPYPAYPAYYWPAPGYIATGVLATGIAFGAGYALARWRYGNNIWGGGVNWRNNDLIVNRPIDINKIGNNWQHNPSHRHGVKYNNADLRQKFARTDARAGKGARQDFRGRSGQQVLDPGRGGSSDRPGAGDRAKAGDRPGAGDREKAGDRPGAGDRGKAGDRSKVGAKGGGKQAAGRPSRPSGASARQRDTAFSGADSGRAARSHAERGRQSMAGHGGAGRVAAGGGPRVGGGGGGFRGGGGGFRGGGGRRSDIALKHDIILLGHLDNGLGFYRFSYNGSRKAYVGVMAQEVHAVAPDAVVRGADGYLRVRYDKLGIQFQTYERWKASGARIPAGIRLHH